MRFAGVFRLCAYVIMLRGIGEKQTDEQKSNSICTYNTQVSTYFKKTFPLVNRMNENTYHVGWVVCLSVCGGRLGECSFLRWSSTGGLGVCILAVARKGIVSVSLRHTSTDHSLPYCNSVLLQQPRPPEEGTPITQTQTAAVYGEHPCTHKQTTWCFLLTWIWIIHIIV